MSHSDSDDEPSPEALARYLAIRRNTVSVGDPRQESQITPHHNQPMPAEITAPTTPMFFNLVSQLPDMNLPMNLPPVQHEPLQNYCIKDPHLLKPPHVMTIGESGAPVKSIADKGTWLTSG